MNELSEHSPKDRMILADVNLLALNLMMKHGLIEQGFYFSFDRAKNRFGACFHDRKMITMSKYLTPQRTYEQNRNTILHEIAHALVGAKHGHDAYWEAQAIEIGCDGERCGKIDADAERPEKRWVAKCSMCNTIVCQFDRAPNRVRYCTVCSPSGFDFNFVLDWYEFGDKRDPYCITDRYTAEYDMLRWKSEPETLYNATEMETVYND